MGSSCWMGKPCHEHKCTTTTLPQNTNILQIYAKLNSIKTFTMSCYRPPTCFQNILFLIQFSSQSSTFTIYNCKKDTCSGPLGSFNKHYKRTVTSRTLAVTLVHTNLYSVRVLKDPPTNLQLALTCRSRTSHAQ